MKTTDIKKKPGPGKGKTNNPNGRPPGTPNKATMKAREAIACFVEGNVERLNGLLDQIEDADGPQAAWDCIVDVLEYHVPKLARTEVQPLDNQGKPTDGFNITVRHVKPSAS